MTSHPSASLSTREVNGSTAVAAVLYFCLQFCTSVQGRGGGAGAVSEALSGMGVILDLLLFHPRGS